MSASLERRYRAALDWYPTAWREANADAMLGTLLDEAEATGRDRPAPAQTLNLLAFALRERARNALPAAVRDRAAALAWGIGAAVAVVMLVCVELAPAFGQRVLPDSVGFGPLVSATAVVLGLWALSFVAALAGAGAVARWMLAATIPASLALVLFDTQPWAALRAPSSSLMFLALFALLALQGSPAATRRGRAWMAVSAIGAAAFVLPTAVGAASTMVSDDTWISRIAWVDVTRPTAWGIALLAVALVAVIARRFVWTAALLLAAVPILLFVTAVLVASGYAVFLGAAVAVIAGAAVLVRRSGYRVVLQRRE